MIIVGGGTGTAVVHPIARGFKEAGNKVAAIMGSRTKDLLIMEDKMKAASHELTVCTDDGSYGHHGFVTDVLKKYLEGPEKVSLVVAAGPVPMMKFVAKMTEPFGVHTLVSLNSIMIDGTGMCGGCRVSVGGKNRFTCVDGPEFDAHQIDFDQFTPTSGRVYGTGKASHGKIRAQLQSRTRQIESRTSLDKGRKMAEKQEKVPRQPMPEQAAEVRRNNFDEVPLGFTPEIAMLEASRCLQCKKPALCDRLSRGNRYSRFHKLHQGRRLSREPLPN